MRKATFLIGAATGYVLGTRSGRERYEQIMQAANRLWQNPTVQQKVSEVEGLASDTAKTRGADLQNKLTEKAKNLTSTAKHKASDMSTSDSASTSGYDQQTRTEPVVAGSTTPTGSAPVIEIAESTSQAGSNGRLA